MRLLPSQRTLALDLVLIALLSALLFTVFLGSYHLLLPDEGRYAEIAREMAISHHWVTPTLNGLPFLDKPILQYWINSFFIEVFGFSEFSARLGSVFIGILGCEFIYLAGRELFDRKTGWTAAILLMTSLLYFFATRYINMDLAVAVWLSGSLYYFLMGMEKPAYSGARLWRLYFAYALAAAAFLTKGLIGILFPMMIIGLWILVLWDWRILAQMRLPSGLALFLLLVAPWYYLAELATPGFWQYFFWTQNFGRFFGLSHFNNSDRPLYFFVPVVLLGLFPWVIFLFQTLKDALKRVMQNKQLHRKELFLLIFSAVVFVFFSIPSAKVIGYLLPIFSPLILLIARYLVLHWSLLRQFAATRYAMLAYILLNLAGAIACVWVTCEPSLTTPESAPYFYFIAGVCLVTAVATFSLLSTKRRFHEFFAVMLLATAMIEIIAAAGFNTFALKTTKPLDLWIAAHAHHQDKIVAFHRFYQDMPDYLQRRIIVVLPNWQDPDIILKEDNWASELAKGLVYAPKNQDWLLNDADFVHLWQSSTTLWVLVNQGNYEALERLLNQHLPIAQKWNGYIVVTNHPPERHHQP